MLRYRPKPPQHPKDAAKAQSGAVSTALAFVPTGRHNKHEEPSVVQDELPLSNSHPDWTGISGIGVGLTIPGPPLSYMSARIDCFVYLPHPPTAAGARRAMQVCEELANEKIEMMANDVRKHFSEQ